MLKKQTLIAPSLLSADFTQLAKTIDRVEDAGIDWHHVDIMDGHFVPNLAFSPEIQAVLKSLTNKVVDTHLMMTYPRDYIDPFFKAGSNRITIHVECENNVSDTLAYIRSLKIPNGLSLKPKTAVTELLPYLSEIDLVLVMTVEPGFGGQSFMKKMLPKITWLKEYREKNGLKFLIEVDGGVNAKTGRDCVEAGADVLVAGSYIYKSDNMKACVDSLR